MPRPRDTQRKRVYTAEHVLERFKKPLPTVADVERFVAKVHDAHTVKTNYTNGVALMTHVKDGRGCRSARSRGGVIVIPLWARNDWVVLHELAHELTSRSIAYRGMGLRAAHGWQFCSTYLDLVLWFMGREAHDALKASFKAHRVRFNKPRQGRVLTVEERAKLTERLAAARAAKAASKPPKTIGLVVEANALFAKFTK
jgi:putative metallohydrolase (TIGR04338 family)